MDNVDLKQKIIDDIKKTGFISELNVYSILSNIGWDVKSNSSYVDKDYEKHREIDCIATKMFWDSEAIVILNMNLIFEIKRSKRPWIIFTNEDKSRFGKFNNFPGWGLLTIGDTTEYLNYEEFGENYIRSSFQRIGKSFHEAFKNPDEPSKIYEALLSACKATVSEYDIHKFYVDMELDDEEATAPTGTGMDIYMPIVLVDGGLFEAFIDDQGDLQVEERKHIPFTFEYSSYKYTDQKYYPEIVALDNLGEFITKMENWMQTTFDHLKKNRVKALNK